MRIPALALVLLVQVIRLCWAVFALDLLNKRLDFLLILKLISVDFSLHYVFSAAQVDELLWDDKTSGAQTCKAAWQGDFL